MLNILNRIINIGKTNISSQNSDYFDYDLNIDAILNEDDELLSEQIATLTNNNGYKSGLNAAYKILGIEKNSSMDEIKTAFNNKLQEFHPDKHNSNDLNEYNYYSNKTIELIASYKLIIKEFK